MVIHCHEGFVLLNSILSTSTLPLLGYFMKHELSFCTINILSDSIAEVIVNNDVEVSLEMVDEYEIFFAEHFSQPFGLLINKINHYHFAFEAKLSIGSDENLKAIAVIDYNQASQLITEDIAQTRKIDGWNLQSFSGLDLGWQSALEWLKKELSAVNG